MSGEQGGAAMAGSGVEAGVVAGALVAAGCAVGAWWSWRGRDEAAALKRADRFAREQNLFLPPELVATVGARLRRRGIVGLLLSVLVAAPVFGLLTAQLVSHWNAPLPAPGQITPFRGPLMWLLFAAPVGPVDALSHLWDVTRVRREAGGTRVARVSPILLADAVPRWLTWAARGAAVLPPLAVAAVAAAENRSGAALVFLVVAGAAAAGVRAAERLQVGMLNGRQSAGSPQELAFDDAFRVSAALPLATVAPVLSALACGACFEFLGRDGERMAGLFLSWTPTVVLLFLLTSAVRTPGVQRYYRRGVPKPPLPESASC